MSYRTQEFLKQIEKTIITLDSENVDEYYFKGWTDSFTTTMSTVGAITFSDIALPTLNQLLQISSTSPADINLPILVQGFDTNFNEIQEVVITNGQNPVNLVNGYFRIKTMINTGTTNTSNIGNIYLSKQGGALLAGVPTLAGNYIYSMKAAQNAGFVLNGCVPPELNKRISPNYIIFNISRSSNNVSGRINFQIKRTNSQIWYTQFHFFVDTIGSNQFTFRLDGVPSISNGDITTPEGYDFRLQGQLVGVGTLSIASSLSLRQFL